MTTLQATTGTTNCSGMTWLLVGDIREMLQDRLDRDAIRWLRPVLDALIDSMCEWETREDSSGFFEDVLDPCPELTPRVEQIQGEQTQLCARLRELRARLERRQGVSRIVRELQADLAEWVQMMTDNARRERELLQSVWYSEIGGEG
jgi:predicted transcriptional regulator